MEELSTPQESFGISLYKRHGGKDRREISLIWKFIPFLSETTFSENALLCPTDHGGAGSDTAQPKGEFLGSRLLIPCNMLKTDEDVFG